jgi:uncharacterized Ntn-hydrolase superfamily protein
VIRRGTYSIVACDPETGAVGVAVQSHWFAVGPLVPWVRPGVGAVATQSIVEPGYGPALLDRLEAGEAPQDALDALVAEDAQAHYRQVAVVDARGRVAVHTGAGCMAHAGHDLGAGFCAQANMMGSPQVWPAMAQAFERASGPLERRLAAAMHAAEAQGGDVRGKQSCAILVSAGDGKPWYEAVDLRVDDHPEPLAELDRLMDLRDAYALASEGDDLAGAGEHEAAGDRYERASRLAPENHELLFWAGLAAAQTGDMPTAVERVQRAIAMQPGWRELLDRLEADIAPSAAVVRDALAAAEG